MVVVVVIVVVVVVVIVMVVMACVPGHHHHYLTTNHITRNEGKNYNSSYLSNPPPIVLPLTWRPSVPPPHPSPFTLPHLLTC